MIKISLSLIVFAISMIFTSCSGLHKQLLENDKLLLEKLTGTWKANNRGTIKINYDGTFIDTILTPLSFVENTYVVNFVLSGKYKIKDGNLHFYDTRIDYSRDAVYKPEKDFVFIIDPRRISFEDEFLMLQEFRMFHAESEIQNSIVAEWQQENQACIYEPYPEHKFICGNILETFSFNSDSLCSYTRKYLFETSFKDESYSKAYYFNAPHLEIDSLENALVLFQDNKMIWFQNDPVFYKRQEIEKD